MKDDANTHGLPFLLPEMPVPRFIPGSLIPEDVMEYFEAMDAWKYSCAGICAANGYDFSLVQDSVIISPREQKKE